MAPDVANRVAREFPSAAARQAAAQILASVTEAVRELNDSVGEQDRVTRCVLFLAGGNLKYLAECAALARRDYRDAIMAAEYDREDRRIRDFSRPFDSD